jgi:hypothetical protein
MSVLTLVATLVLSVLGASCTPPMRGLRTDSPAKISGKQSVVFWRVRVRDTSGSCHGGEVIYRFQRKLSYSKTLISKTWSRIQVPGSWDLSGEVPQFDGMAVSRALPGDYRLRKVTIGCDNKRRRWATFRIYPYLRAEVDPGRLMHLGTHILTLRYQRAGRLRRLRLTLQTQRGPRWIKAATNRLIKQYPKVVRHYKRRIKVAPPTAREINVTSPERAPREIAKHRKACLRGHAGSCVIAGAILSKLGGDQREAEARRLLGKACDKRHPVGCKVLCLKGRAKRCDELGLMYAQGRGVKRDHKQAALFYRKGCAGGNPGSCNRLGVIYADGRGVPKDLAAAAKLYQQACRNRHAYGCYNLARALERGRGLPENLAEAAKLYGRLCNRESTHLIRGRACNRLALLTTRGKGVPRNHARAHRLYERSCRLGYKWGCHNVGNVFRFGQGRPKNPEAAVPYYEKACSMSNGRSCLVLSKMIAAGEGAGRDPARAGALREKACRLGHKAACGQAPARRTARRHEPAPTADGHPARRGDRPAARREGKNRIIPAKYPPYAGGRRIRLSGLRLSPSGVRGSLRLRRLRRGPYVLVVVVSTKRRRLVAYFDAKSRFLATRQGRGRLSVMSTQGAGLARKGGRLHFEIPDRVYGVYSLRGPVTVTVFALPGKVRARTARSYRNGKAKPISNVLTARGR